MARAAKDEGSRRARRLGAAFALGLALSGVVPSARADEPKPEEVTYRPDALPPQGTQTRLILTGAGVLVGWYGVSLGSSYLWSDAPNAESWRVPIVGPWLDLGNSGCGEAEPGCDRVTRVLRTTLTLTSSIAQAGGLFALVEGLLLSEQAPGAGLGSNPRDRRRSSFTAVAVPLPGGAGLSVSGRF